MTWYVGGNYAWADVGYVLLVWEEGNKPKGICWCWGEPNIACTEFGGGPRAYYGNCVFCG